MLVVVVEEEEARRRRGGGGGEEEARRRRRRGGGEEDTLRMSRRSMTRRKGSAAAPAARGDADVALVDATAPALMASIAIQLLRRKVQSCALLCVAGSNLHQKKESERASKGDD